MCSVKKYYAAGSPTLYSLGPVTADRVYNIVKARADKRKEVAEDAQQRKEQRIEKERDGQRALAAEGEQVKVGEVADNG